KLFCAQDNALLSYRFSLIYIFRYAILHTVMIFAVSPSLPSNNMKRNISEKIVKNKTTWVWIILRIILNDLTNHHGETDLFGTYITLLASFNTFFLFP
ncbi:MAG: hypothetical protein RR313_12475, partial [Anaerovoracaceae bacterium]